MAEIDDPTISDSNPKSNNKSTYVMVHRSFHEGYLRRDASAQAVLLYLICKAQRFPKESGGKIYKPGDVISSIMNIMDVTGLKRKAIMRCINKLEKGGTISTRRDKTGTYISLCNYEKYQLMHDHDSPRQGVRADTRSDTRTGTYYNKERNKKETNKEIKGGIELTPQEERIWFSYAKAYEALYAVSPILNLKQVDYVRKLSDLLGESASDVASFYCSVHTSFYVSKRHTLDFCALDAEKLHTAYQQSLGGI